MPASALNGGVREDRAFEELYGCYGQNVYRYLFAVLGQQADAEDATQQTFLNAYRALRRGERPERPERWLITIAHNTCRQRYRHAQRRPREVSLDEAMTTAGFEDDSPTTAEELKQALLCLPPSQRSALVMRELEGRSYDETARALRISSAALGTLLFRARESLREQLEEPMSCGEARAAIAIQRDSKLPASETRTLRAHLRSCDGCATLARSRRAQKRMPRGGLLSLPGWIARLLPTGAGASATGAGAVGIALKAAAVVALGTVAAGGLYAGSDGRLGSVAPRHRAPAPAVLLASSVHAQIAAPRAVPVAPSVHVAGTGSPPVFDTSSSGVVAAAAPIASEPATPSSAPTDGTTTASTGESAGAAPVATATTEAASPSVTTETTAVSTDATVPPGQAKKTATTATATTTATDATPSGNVPPGQAKKNDAATTATATVTDATPSGNVPPGQAKKNDTTTATTTATPTTTTIDTTPSGKVPPGQAKKGTAP